MTVETALYPNQLDNSLPTAADLISEGDDHIRLLKTVLKTTFPNVTGAVTVSQVTFNLLGRTPALTDYSTGPASTQFVVDKINQAVFSPGAPVPDFLLQAQGVI